MQKLELTWIGKGHEPAVEPRILIHDASKDYGDAGTNNMLIHGDNLLALKALEQEFAGKVKCIYIDPPYNTGAAFEHYNDNLEHSTWLSLMVPRLRCLRNLLREDGSIWISIDDDEYAYLKVLCDEVFKRENFVASVVWQKRTSPDARLPISTAHDYILIYTIKKDSFLKTVKKLPLSDTQMSRYKNPDNDPRGPWVTSDFSAQIGHATPQQFYEIIAPNGKRHKPPANRCWRMIESSYFDLLKDGRIWFGKDGNGVPYKKMYLAETKGYNAWTWWANDEFGHNKEAKQEILNLFGREDVFNTPKPERLIERILTLATQPGDLVLDSFLGSGTTAAVAHKMKRRYIGIELGDHCYTHCIPRLKSVIDGEQGGISKSVNWQGGGGFKFYELAPTLIVKDENGFEIISERYNAAMLAAAVAKLCGYRYAPRDGNPYIHGENNVGGFIFVTTEYVSAPRLGEIAKRLSDTQSLVICASAFQMGIKNTFSNIRLRKIPQTVLSKCEYGADNYNLNVVDLPDFEETEEDFEDVV
jgi:adenine-specific DNA-methyltransferase